MSAQEFRELFDAVTNWGRWDNDRGALNHLSPDRIAAAARLVRSGATVTLSQPLPTASCIDVPEPADHHMTMLPEDDAGSVAPQFTKDYIGVDYHNDGHSHVDAFCHVAFDGFLFDGAPESSVTAEGAHSGTIELLKDGLVGRGVLIDVPRVRGVPGVEPGDGHLCHRPVGVPDRDGDDVDARSTALVQLARARPGLANRPWELGATYLLEEARTPSGWDTARRIR